MSADPTEAPERAIRVKFQRTEGHAGEYDRIVVAIADLSLSCDPVNDRQIRLAHRLAFTHGADVVIDDVLKDRVTQALTPKAPR